MKVLVLGCGRMGRAAAWDLARQPDVTLVGLGDRSESAVRAAAREVSAGGREGGARAEVHVVDLAGDADLVALLAPYDVVLSSADYRFHEAVTRAAIAARTSICDLGGNLFVVQKQLALSESARAAGITVVPDCGLAPGLAGLLAARAVEEMTTASHVRIRVGGLPANPKPPLCYKLVFSVRGLTNEYLEPADVLRDGVLRRVPSLTEVEPIEFRPPFGVLEAFNTSGGVSTLPMTLGDRVPNIDYKTIRHPGHCAAFAGMAALGLFSEEPVNGVAPRHLLETLIERSLTDDDTDVVLVRVTVDGTRDGAPTRRIYEIIDHHDPVTGHSAMARTTAYPAAAVAHFLGSGRALRHGVLPGEAAFRLADLVAAVRERGIAIEERWEPLG